MLRQDINLYTSFVKPPTTAELITWRRYWYANAVFTGIMIIITLLTLIHHYHAKYNLTQASMTMASNQEKFEKMKTTLPQVFFGSNINEAVEKMQKEMSTQKKVVGFLSQQHVLSESLMGLSRTIVANVWLTKITIAHNGADIALAGNSLGMTNLNEFMERLNKDKLYQPYDVTIKNVDNKDAENPNAKLSFELSLVKGGNE